MPTTLIMFLICLQFFLLFILSHLTHCMSLPLYYSQPPLSYYQKSLALSHNLCFLRAKILLKNQTQLFAGRTFLTKSVSLLPL